MNFRNLITNKTLLIFGAGVLLLLSACSKTADAATITPEITTQEYTSTVSATGVVVPAQSSTLSVSTAGIVEQVLAEEGEIVAAGQILLRLEGKEDLQAAIESAEYEFTLAQQALDELYENNTIEQANALQSTAQAYEALRQAEYDAYYFSVPSNQRDFSIFEGADVTRESLAEARETYEPYKGSSSEFTYIDCDEVEAIKQFPALCGSSERYDVEDQLEDAEADFKTAVDRIENQSAVILATENLRQALNEYETLTQGPDPDELAAAEARLENAQASLDAAQAYFEDLEVLAPFAGTVSKMHTSVSEWIAPGQPSLLIADLEHLRIETTDLSEVDIAQVAVGDFVAVTFDALPDVEVAGQVTRIAPKADEGSGVNYKVVVELDEIPAQLRWGMTAFVDIEN
jgi:HlyD family secretion protein